MRQPEPHPSLQQPELGRYQPAAAAFPLPKPEPRPPSHHPIRLPSHHLPHEAQHRLPIHLPNAELTPSIRQPTTVYQQLRHPQPHRPTLEHPATVRLVKPYPEHPSAGEYFFQQQLRNRLLSSG